MYFIFNGIIFFAYFFTIYDYCFKFVVNKII